MNKITISLAIILAGTYTFGQNWKSVSEAEAYPSAKREYQDKRNQKIFTLDRKTLDQKLTNVAQRHSDQVGIVITMPNINGNLERFEVWEASNFSEKLQTKFSNIRSYVGKSLEDPSAYLRFSTGPSGISSTIFRANEKSEYLETYSTDGKYFEVHNEKSAKDDFACLTENEHAAAQSGENIDAKHSDQKFRTYRLALSVTGEYTQYFGGTVEKALEAMNNTMTRVNGVFEKDMALNFVLADNVESLIFLDPTTDPYSNSSSMNSWNRELQNHLTTTFGSENYDIGHLFGDAGGGGNAGCIGCICNDANKGSGFTSPADRKPFGDKFDIDYVAHEIGHQIGANHTFSNNIEGTGVNVEPGGGSTIMGYAGITSYNVQANSDDYFTYRSILQVQNNLKNKTCGIQKPILNTPPKIELVKTSYTIPISTAFKLDAKITDAENDAFLTTWEQNNSGNSTTEDGNSRVKQTKTVGPNFRSFAPVKETYRYFPKFSSILTNKLLHTGTGNSVWESVTSVARNYDFTVTARDYNPQGPQTNTASVKIIASNAAGPFIVNTPNDTDNKLMLNASNFDVTWNVANTNIAPVNTAKVKVSISWDNGSTFEELGVVDNTGAANFALPANAKDVTNGYIMIEAVDNVYLAVKKFSTGTLATKELDAKKSLIYPNPSNGSFTIEQKTSGKVSVEIIDLNGRTVYTSSENASGNFKKQIDTKLPAGVYVVKVSSDEGQSTSKLIIK